MAKSRILIVDDEESNINLIQKLLSDKNYEIDSSLSGHEAIKMIKLKKYDLVLLDIFMPQINGYEVCRSIHTIAPDIYVIMLTGLSDDEALKKSFEVGAVDCIRKPLNETELISRIKNILNIKSTEEKVKNLYVELLKDLDMASDVQAYLIPEWIHLDRKLQVSSIYEASQKVSGDIFDIIRVSEHRHIVYMGDISGHGVQAALLMTAVKSVINLLINSMKDNLELYRILNRLNKLLIEELLHKNYLSILISLVDTEENTITYFNAGHPPMIEYNTITKTAKTIQDKGGMPIGWIASVEYLESETNVIPLDPDCTYLMYTDGVFECDDKDGNLLGLDGFINMVNDMRDCGDVAIIPYSIKFKLLDLGYNCNLDDFSLLSLSKADERKDYQHFFKINPLLHHVAEVGDQIKAITKEKTKNDKLAVMIELVINEFLNNIIIHGINHNRRNDSKIYVNINFEEKIIITFWDKGVEWNPENVDFDDPFKDENDVFAVSGRGIKIIYSVASSFDRKRIGEVNETKITIKNELE
jgi:serine phosphatase RsbU (regulator of sigma subunit)/anti-sigma regulatory factor (Ser/Thr protein kinase)